jgi:uncharacterized protein
LVSQLKVKIFELLSWYTFSMIIVDIKEQLKTAMREKNQTALDTLRSVMSACTNELVASGKTPQDEVTDEMVLKVIGRLIKQRKDSISQFEAGGRNDLAESEKEQLAILEQFQPPQMGEDELRAIAMRKKEELGITDKAKAGILTGAVMKEVSGQADGALVKSIIESLF